MCARTNIQANRLAHLWLGIAHEVAGDGLGLTCPHERDDVADDPALGKRPHERKGERGQGHALHDDSVHIGEDDRVDGDVDGVDDQVEQ